MSTPGGTTSSITSISLRIDHGVGLAGLSTVQLPAASAGAIFQAAISSGKLNGMIWPDHAERLVEVVGVGLLVDLRDRALLGAHRAGEVAEVVDRQRHVGAQRLAHRLAVLPALGDGEHLEVLLDRVGDRVEHGGALGRRATAPTSSLAACAASSASSTSAAPESATSQNGLAGRPA